MKLTEKMKKQINKMCFIWRLKIILFIVMLLRLIQIFLFFQNKMTITLENSNAKKLPQYVAALSGKFVRT